MLTIISPEEFATIPWKNGLGETTELAINDDASLGDFIWRLSIASVANDGVFSDFSGYERNLILIEGEGITLEHDGKSRDVLANKLDVANFDGGCETMGSLAAGAIRDFNIITAKDKVLTQVDCYIAPSQVEVTLAKNTLCFVYSLSGELIVQTSQQEGSKVSQGSLAKLTLADSNLSTVKEDVYISGEDMIVVQLELKGEQ